MRFTTILKHIGRAIFSLIAIAACSVLFSAAALVPYREPETVDPQKLLTAEAVFMMKDIYMSVSQQIQPMPAALSHLSFRKEYITV